MTVVSSGVTSSGLTISSGGSLAVLSGGEVVSSTVLYGGTATLSAGGSAAGLTMNLGDLVIEAGASASGTILTSATPGVFGSGTAEVYGVETGAAIDIAGVETVESGGLSVNAIINGGWQFVTSGGVASGAVISGPNTNGRQIVYSGGLAVKTKVLALGSIEVLGGAKAQQVSVSHGGFAFVESGGTLVGEKTGSGGVLQTEAGAAISNATIASGGTLEFGFDAYGSVTASNVTVSSGGAIQLDVVVSRGQSFTAGILHSTTNLSGVTAFSGASVDLGNVTVLSGGVLKLNAGSVTGEVTVSSGGRLIGAGNVGQNGGFVFDAGLISNLTIGASSQPGSVVIEQTGSAVGVTLDRGVIVVSSGGYISGTKLAGPGTQTQVHGTAVGTRVGSGALEVVSSGGVSEEAVISSGGLAYVAGLGVASGMLVRSGGVEEADGNSFSGVIMNGGVLIDDYMAALTGTVVSGGGEIEFSMTLGAGQTFHAGAVTSAKLFSGATFESGSVIGLNNVYVESGGVLILNSGAIASQLTVTSGGQVLGSGGAIVTGQPGYVDDVAGLISGVSIGVTPASSTNPYNGYGAVELTSGGLASGLTVRNGYLYVDARATAKSTTVLSGGGIIARGSISGATISAGGVLTVSGTVVGVTVSSGGLEVLQAGGTTSGAVVSSGGELAIVFGLASGAVVMSGGAIASGGLLSGASTVSAVLSNTVYGGATVSSGAYIDLYSAFLTSGATVSVTSGGMVTDTVVQSGALLSVGSGGMASATQLMSGGKEIVLAGANAVGVSMFVGGELVDDGVVRMSGYQDIAGTLVGSGQIVQVGSSELVLNATGSQFTGAVVISGGTVDIAVAGAIGTGTIQYVEPATGSETLQVGAAAAPRANGTFANTLSNFNGANESLDLMGLTYVSGATAKVSGSQLVLTDGGKIYRFNLAGASATAYTVTSDGSGGTTISPKALAMIHAAAAFSASTAGLSPISSGGASAAATPFAAGTSMSGAGLHH